MPPKVTTSENENEAGAQGIDIKRDTQFIKLIKSSGTVLKRFLESGINLISMTARHSGSATQATSGSMMSADNSAAASDALSKASDVIVSILQDHMRELELLSLIAKVEPMRESRMNLSAENSNAFHTDNWDIIKKAIDYSVEAYNRNAATENDLFIKPTSSIRHIKAAIIEVVTLNGTPLIIVAIRGSLSLDDWLLNVNGNLAQSSSKILDSTSKYHRGFLRSFEDSEDEIAKGINEIKTKNSEARRLLFTGHSAGGALAQLYYNSSKNENSPIDNAIKGIYFTIP
ncbi:uncharacterized protein TrAFT101_004411 [Trichoderma asperellum]|uniref:uncharacterized protein n=1 Tax=Trichoderma asperellum TaxID=101201 RepID=UPI003317127C|nr:hypothetical protein TrAFT101_004411 [Trichoderma asperellum]